MAKKIVGFIKLQVPAGKANPCPPIGPALGQRGLNIMEFCKAFNAQTQKLEPGLPIPVVITAFADKSFTFIMKTPPATVLIKKAAKVDKGSPQAPYGQGWQADPRASRGNRQGQDARPDRRRSGCRGAHDRRQRPQHGHHRRRGEVIMAEQKTPHLSKRMQVVRSKVDRAKFYPVDDALKLVKESATAKFDESVDVAVNLGVDAKKSDQTVRGSVVLPAGTGKNVRVAVFAQGDKAKDATAAGADIVGFDDLAAKIKEGFMDFDVVIASPDAMRVVGQLGQILGPRGLMPNPKVGTVSADVVQAVKNAKAGQVQYRTDKAGIIQCTIGRASFTPEQLKTNLLALIEALNKAKPQGLKGVYLQQDQPVVDDGRRRSRRPDHACNSRQPAKKYKVEVCPALQAHRVRKMFSQNFEGTLRR